MPGISSAFGQESRSPQATDSRLDSLPTKFVFGSAQKKEFGLFGSGSPTPQAGAQSSGPPPTPTPQKVQVQKHSEYFFNDGNVVIQVEDIQYNLHRSLLALHSPVFRELFTLPQPVGSTEGRADDHPITLSGIRAMDFTRFLWLLYPPSLGFCKVSTVDEWLSVMDQADRWQIDSLRARAIAQLRELYIEPVRKVLIWHRYSLPSHELIPSYMDIISRSQPLSVGEAQDLGLHLFVKIAHAPDLVHSKGACRCCACPKVHGSTSASRDRILEDIIRTVLGISRA
ncbi:hypothetical protein BV20DRAFT_959582 [Pilatotrama ljubarskyi]|nr:hypothetical protein BV20DRAFT_959582 [Pilatotrama ljubarskyi]